MSKETARLWQLLKACDETHSLLKASIKVGMPLATASRIISEFEKAHSVTLLDRSSRPAGFTEAFARIMPQVRAILCANDSMADTLEQIRKGRMHSELWPLVRIALPVNVRNSRVLKNLLLYAGSHHLRLEFAFEPGYKKLVSKAVDIAQMGFAPDDPAIVKRYVRTNGFLILASRDFVKARGLPQAIQDLEHLPVSLRNPSNWSFSRKFERGTETYYLPEGNNLIYGDALTCRELLLAGMAIAIDVSIGSVLEELKSGLVVPVLPGWFRQPNDTYVCCRSEDAEKPVIRGLMDVIRDTLKAERDDRWDLWYERLGMPLETIALYQRED